MKISSTKLIALIAAVVAITGSLVAGVIELYDWNDSIATKTYVDSRLVGVNKQINLVAVTSRLRDVEDSIKFYQRLNIELDEFGKEHYEKLKQTFTRLEHERDLLTGISTNP